MTLEGLTLVSTGCIVASGVAYSSGWFLIRVPRRVAWHRNVMLLATGLAGHFWSPTSPGGRSSAPSTSRAPEVWRTLYFANLIPHVILAIAVGPLAVRLIWLALVEARLRAHRRLARVTLPIWLYVAASGWIVYYMLYRMQF